MGRFRLPILAWVFVHVMITNTAAKECIASAHFRMDNCTHEVFLGSVGWDTKSLCDNITQNDKDNRCMNKPACGKTFRASIFDQQLFSITMKNTFIDMLTRCCRNCAKCSVVNEIEETMNLNESILNSSDVIFPVLGEASLEKLQGFHFLPVYKVPSSIYFTLKRSNNVIMGEVVLAVLNLWPFLLICLLFALISGFIVWVIETPLNREEFPRSFYSGIFDGCWWSFISMTTVGFGDKVTKSYLGKIYAVFWILIGITMCSMFTASLTSEIINARSPASTDMAGKDVGVAKGRLHDIDIVAHQGGMLHIGSIGHTMRSIHEMVTMLENKTIQGFLIDRNTYYHFLSRSKEKKYKHIAKRIKDIDVVKTEKFHSQDDLSCGIMVKDWDDYKYFKGYLDSNRLDVQSCNSVRMNTRHTKATKGSNMFAPDGNLFGTVLAYSIAILSILILVGLLIEGRRYYVKLTDVSSKVERPLSLTSVHKLDVHYH